MSDKSYDVVVMGGGHNALVLACYLTRNGMKVGVFEEKWEHEQEKRCFQILLLRERRHIFYLFLRK